MSALVDPPRPFVPRVDGAVDIELLGPLQVLDDAGVPVDLPGAKPRALLALLALRAPDLVTTDAILDAVWGDGDLADPAASLHVAVSRLRKSLGDGVVATAPGGYRLDLPVSNTDLERFRQHTRRGRQLATLGHPGRAAESFRHALAQWRGTPLADVPLDFADRASAQLEEERLGVVEALIEAEIDAGDHDLVVGELAGLVDAFPLREHFWRQFMLALYRSGRQAEALRAYQRLRTTLAEELGIEPSPELVDLEERILLHDPSLTAMGEGPVERPSSAELASFDKGDVIVEEGSRADTVYWIESGRVEVLRAGDDGELEPLAELGPGRYFGELASLLRTGRTATVRAIEPTTVSIHDATGLRNRLGSGRTDVEEPAGSIDAIRELIRRGEYLAAFDAAMTAIDRGATDLEPRHLAVLALARAGSTSQARRLFDRFALASADPSLLTPQLATNIPALSARLDKDMAFGGGPDAASWARRSAEGYEAAFAWRSDAYLGANAATMWLVAGDPDRARTVATTVRALLDEAPPEATYWHHANVAEVALVLGDEVAAADALATAASLTSTNYAERATTLRNLRRVCELVGIDPVVLRPIHNPGVVHYVGHRILAPGEDGRFPASDEARVRARLDEVLESLEAGFGFGSLAAGADILAAEALLDRGAQLNVTLPFDRDEFVRTSVLPAGTEWVHRFERCLASADRVRVATEGEYLDDPTLFDFCARVAMGDAVRRAGHLSTEAHQVAVWDGVETGGVAGTSADVARWRAAGLPVSVIDVEPSGSGGGAGGGRRSIKAVVFADFAGFSTLTDAQVLRFQETAMAALSAALDPHRHHISSARTWGDGVYLVLDDVPAAAAAALSMQAAAQALDFAGLGLPGLRGLRIAAHATPVFEGWDPIAETPLVFGSGVTTTARVEPKTPVGEIFVTHPFASLSVLGGDGSFDCQYVGMLPTAKGYGELPLYSLRARES
jgi:adenylate cyclase